MTSQEPVDRRVGSVTRAGWRALAAGALAIGCGQVTTAGPSAVHACTDLAQALCAKRASCTNSTGITRADGDMATCISREELTCTIALAAPDSGNNPDLVERCVAAYATYSCADFQNGNPPAVCAPAGGRGAGAPCTFNGQCGSAFCARVKNAVCGSCAAAPAPCDSCAISGCGHDQTCAPGTTTCVVLGDVGAACGADAPCGAGLNCITDAASGAATCQIAAASTGARCGAGTAGCDGAMGLFCGGAVGAKSCMAVTYGGDGAACGLLPDGTRAGCKAGDCYTATGLARESDAGTCKANAADGAACDAVLGPPCAPPARCVPASADAASATTGICTVPDATTCL